MDWWIGKEGLIKHTDVETLASEKHKKDNSLWVSLKMTPIRAKNFIYLVQILNLHIKITLGFPKTVWKIKW